MFINMTVTGLCATGKRCQTAIHHSEEQTDHSGVKKGATCSRLTPSRTFGLPEPDEILYVRSSHLYLYQIPTVK